MSYIKKFGFGTKTGIDLNGEGKGILFNVGKVGEVELATTAFGQGVSVTPIQQITAVSAAINGGHLYKPYVVKRVLEPTTNSVIVENNKTLVRNVISKSASKEVRRALESVVANGTGRNAYIEGHSVGGKTGTAQKVNNGVYMVGNYIVSFIGFTPVDNPKVIVYVAIDNPKAFSDLVVIAKDALAGKEYKPAKIALEKKAEKKETKVAAKKTTKTATKKAETTKTAPATKKKAETAKTTKKTTKKEEK